MQKEIRKTISKIKETGLQLLFPGRCPVCDGIVRPFGRKICPECLPKLKPVTAPHGNLRVRMALTHINASAGAGGSPACAA